MHSRTLHPDGTLSAGLRVSGEASRENYTRERLSTLRLSTRLYTVPTDYRTILDGPKGSCSYTDKRRAFGDAGSLPA